MNESTKIKKPLTKKWWFWVLCVFGAFILLAIIAPKDTSTTSQSDNKKNIETTAEKPAETTPTAKTTAESQEETPKIKPGITMENYEALEIGMTLEEVREILGNKGELSSASGSGSISYEYYNFQSGLFGDKIIICAFENGKLVSKSQVGL
ncbi:MAG TPA: DUF3862 domain-containing protein [Candidatus Kapabacteria bacterium]|nr:DUF3862 domain-containing protein [Candidatus Kapabacteria bacterium]